MKTITLKGVLLTATLLICFSSFSQETDNKVDKIIELTKSLTENENNRQIYHSLFTDGQIHRKKFALAFFNKNTLIGAYSEKYVLKDNALCKLWIGERDFLKDSINVSTTTFKIYIYKDEKLCYYSEAKHFEKSNKNNIRLYQIEYFIDNDKTLKINIDGEFNLDQNKYLRKVIRISKEKVKKKNEIIK